MDTKETVVGVLAMVTAFAGGDYLDAIEPTTHTHVIDEQCTVTRSIEKEL
jgi:hypothetical protein